MASGLQDESLFIRNKSEVGIDAEPLPFFGFETSVLRLDAPEMSLAAKVGLGHDTIAGGNMSNTLFKEDSSRINTVLEIKFGQTFLLLHAVSQMHVAVFPSRASQDPDCVTLVLVKPGEVAPNFCEFTFTSWYKIHEEGSAVCCGDEVLLRLASQPLFVHLSSQPTVTLSVSFAEFANRNSGLCGVGMLEVNMSEERGVVLLMQCYDTAQD